MASRYTAEEIRKMTPAKRREAAREKMLASDRAGMTEGPRSPIPVPRPKPKSEAKGSSLKGIMSRTPAANREKGREKIIGETPPKKTSTRHVHASSTNRKTTPKKAPLAPQKGRQSGMYKASSKGVTSAKIPQYEKKKKQLKRSKSWSKRYATGGKDDRK